MPITLPAPADPQLGTVEMIQAAGMEYVVAAFQQVRVHVSGPEVVARPVLEATIAGGQSLSDVVRQIQAIYYAAGYPAVQITYVLAEPDLYVLVVLGKVDRIDVPAPYDAYFDGIASADPLTDEAIESALALASVHADRAGERAMPTFRIGPEGVVLSIEPDDQGPKQGSIGAEFGNPGNRFVGRHFLDYNVRFSFGSGDEFKGSGRHALVGLEDGDDAAGYHDHAVGWSRVTSLGLFGITGRYVNYQQDVVPLGSAEPIRLDGDIRQAEAAWVYLLNANFDGRWTLGAKLDYSRKDFSLTRDEDQVIQRQEYGSAELSTDFANILRLFGLHTDIAGGIAVRSGLGDDKIDNPTARADLGYLLVRPSASLRTRLGESLSFGLGLSGQITRDTLPEQQQWVVGGVGNGEAYLPGVAGGDTGGVARAQIEFGLGQVGGGFTLTPRVFAEYAYTRYENELPGPPPRVITLLGIPLSGFPLFDFPGVEEATQDGFPDGKQTLADAGVSLSLTYSNWVEVSVSYAESLNESGIDGAVLKDADANLFFRVAIQL
ncbi:MAG: ShlB/FhaC/HecB family hemolysin secretion/activation protein [Panacagrimonas sp.]